MMCDNEQDITVTSEDLDQWVADNPERVRDLVNILDEHDEVIKNLGSDYDDNGMPYWDTKEFQDKIFETQQTFEE